MLCNSMQAAALIWKCKTSTKHIPKAIFREVLSSKVTQNMFSSEVILIIQGDTVFVDCYFVGRFFVFVSQAFWFPSELSASISVTLFCFCYFSEKYCICCLLPLLE